MNVESFDELAKENNELRVERDALRARVQEASDAWQDWSATDSPWVIDNERFVRLNRAMAVLSSVAAPHNEELK